MTSVEQPVVVSRIVDECPGVKTFRFDMPENLDFGFSPGQFVLVAFPGAPELKRAYSIASSPLEKGYIEITLSKVTRFTDRMFGLRGGETLLLSGPYGAWIYRDEIRHAVFVSGGTGISPFRSMIRYALGKGLPCRMTLMHSARTPSDILYREELEEFARKGVQVHVTITRPHAMAQGETWKGDTGRIDMDTLRSRVPALTQAHYYLCGPDPFVDSLKKSLAASGLPKDQILCQEREKN